MSKTWNKEQSNWYSSSDDISLDAFDEFSNAEPLRHQQNNNNQQQKTDNSTKNNNKKSGNSNNNKDGDHHEAVRDLTRLDTHIVRVCRLFLLVVIILAGSCVASFTARVLNNEEDDDYETSYRLFVDTIGDMTRLHVDNFVQVFESVSDTITAAARDSADGFPFVTVPHFEILGSHVRTISRVEMFAFVPLIAEEQKVAWQTYAGQQQGWVAESRDFAVSRAHAHGAAGAAEEPVYMAEPIVPFIYQHNETGHVVPAPGPGPYAPIWQVSPPPFHSGLVINYNMMAETFMPRLLEAAVFVKDGIMSAVMSQEKLSGTAISEEAHRAFHDQYVEDVVGVSPYDRPHSTFVQPVFNKLHDADHSFSKVVGVVMAMVPWDAYMGALLPDGVHGITVVLRNTCNQSYTYVLYGGKAKYLGEGDQHDNSYDHTEMIIPLSKFSEKIYQHVQGHCAYSFYVYSSDEFYNNAQSNLPAWSAVGVAALFFIMTSTFFMYDLFVSKRNHKIIRAAAKANALLASLFPSNVRERLFADHTQTQTEESYTEKGGESRGGPRSSIANYLTLGAQSRSPQNGGATQPFKSKPIADLFPDTTVMFADIAGFTAWSSVREPSHVFTLLETLYHAFDEIARRKHVFKVETVGDCYVAVTGLPEPQKDHAVIMARFAQACLRKARRLTRDLEMTLGPDTADLALRIGLHSGPVTAGVLRGERSRFQLFGDTMNTASRMESTGERERIQLSQETATLLAAAGKQDWFVPRDDVVVAKGKGVLQTFWLEMRKDSKAGSQVQSCQQSDNETAEDDAAVTESLWTSSTALDDVEHRDIFDPKTSRLIDWNVDVLARLLKNVVVQRSLAPSSRERVYDPPKEQAFKQRALVIDEVKEIITLPKFDAQPEPEEHLLETMELSDIVLEQLHNYVCNIAAVYRDNPFHNFEHASHVTMSVTKLLSRIVAPADIDWEDDDDDDLNDIILVVQNGVEEAERAVDHKEDHSSSSRKRSSNRAGRLHDHTYGITSDPLTQFACVFAALIHDCDHSGVPNAQLLKEQTDLALFYQGKSIAEQNSVNLAWKLLMDGGFHDLRAAIYRTDAELRRFRQLVVNLVMATDIVDKELKTLRNLRWDRAFNDSFKMSSFSSLNLEGDDEEDTNRKATIVIEHMIQASDVAHTMQHWHIYRKWNERFFEECYFNYITGRAETNPADGWYRGELGFFDFYILPLAKKLKDCGVFGVSSDEYLNYAEKNRKEWEERGQEIVNEMLAKMQATYPNIPVSGPSERCMI